jgi:hypothetical protein
MLHRDPYISAAAKQRPPEGRILQIQYGGNTASTWIRYNLSDLYEEKTRDFFAPTSLPRTPLAHLQLTYHWEIRQSSGALRSVPEHP